MPVKDCMCDVVPSPTANSAFLFLMFKGECYKPSNTGRLIADVAKANFAFTWHRTEPQQALLDLLQDPRYIPMIIFPHEYAEPERCISSVTPKDEGRTPLFIMLDGTWREARKMFKKSAYLQHLPVLGVSPSEQSDYMLREAAHDYQLCTAEVGIEVLRLAGEGQSADALSSYFKHFRRQYLKGKPHLTDKNEQAENGLD